MNWSIDNYWLLFVLLLLPVFIFFLVNYLRWKKSKQSQFAEQRFQELLFPKKTSFSRIFLFFYGLALFFLLLAIIDLVGGINEVKTTQKVNNVLFALDVSNSMDAEDIQPSRLQQAKNILLNTLPQMKNNRVGIVVFAGEATSIMPLTTDYSAAETYISTIEPRMMKIQGTDFLKAMQVAVTKFRNVTKGSRTVILISDGEDNEGNEKRAAKLAKEEGISVATVGIGTEEGAPVPEYVFGQLMGYKQDRNMETVISKRESGALKNLASETGGVYIDGNDLNNAIREITENISSNSSATTVTVQSQNSEHFYQYFLAVSLFFFFMIYLFNPKRDLNV